MRYFLTGRHPKPVAILLVESGSRELTLRLVGGLRASWCGDLPIDLATCIPELPDGLSPETTRIYRPDLRRSLRDRISLVRTLSANRYSQLGIVCSNEPPLAKWKWALALAVSAKVFIVNENGDYFWLDIRHLGALARFAADRSGLAGAGAARSLARILAFPAVLIWLLLYAAGAHLRRTFHRLGGTRLA